MKQFIHIILITSLSFLSAIAQDQKNINPPETNPEILKINKFLRYDSDKRPFTDEEIQKFCDYIKENPIVKELKSNDIVPIRKIDTAQYFYENTMDENQKKKILDLMLKMFTDIQVARDVLGVDPLSRTEFWLYAIPPLPPTDLKGSKDLNDQMGENQRRFNERSSNMNRLSSKISNLQHIHAYLHRAITRQMKIPMKGISPTLERSHAEKARTKDFLEKQAAAAGRKKPEPKTPLNGEK